MAPVGSVPAARPSTYIDSGTVASEIDGASVAPTIEPVAKMTAELAPVSAGAAASRRTVERARASLAISSMAVVSNIGIPARQAPAGSLSDSRHYEEEPPRDQPMQTGARYALASPFFDEPNTRIRLLAGICTVSIKTGPTLSANLSTSPISRTPHSGSRPRRLVSNTALLSAVCLPSRLKWP